MTTQRLLNLLLLVSTVATLAAIYIWRQTGELPPPLLIRCAVVALIAALVGFVISEETRPRLMLRFLAALFATIGLVAFAADFSSTGTEHAGFAATSLLERLSELAPSLLNSIKTSVTRSLGPNAWDSVMTTVLGLPAFLIFAALAASCGFAGRPRKRIEIFVN